MKRKQPTIDELRLIVTHRQRKLEAAERNSGGLMRIKRRNELEEAQRKLDAAIAAQQKEPNHARQDA